MTRRVFGCALFAVAAKPQQRADIRTTVRLVVIPTSVKDREGHPVDGLEERDFEVKVDGRIIPHKFEADRQQISLVMAVETSANSGPALAKIVKAAPMIEPLISGERGEVALVSFGGNIQVKQQFDSGLNVRLFRDFRPRGHEARIIDAVDKAAELLESRPGKRRRVIVTIGETRDTGSTEKLDTVLARVQRANISIFALTYSPFLTTFTVKPSERLGTCSDNEPAYQAGRSQNDLMPLFRGLGNLGKASTTEILTQATGGLQLRFIKQDTLEDVIQRASEDLHSQYVLTIEAPGDPESRFRTISMNVRRENAVVRARTAYWAGIE